MLKIQNISERVKLSRQLEETFLSLYDPEKKLPPLNKLRTTRGIMNRAIRVMKGFIENVRNNSILSSIVPSYHEDDLKFIDTLFQTLKRTNIKLAFTPSRVPPKEYDNFGVLYYHGQDIEKEDPMIVDNNDDYTYTPTLDSENKDPLPSTKEQTTDKSDDKDFLKDDFNSIISVHTKCEGSIIGSLPILISSWCELNNLNKAATFHIVSELFRNMYEALENFDFRKED